MSVRAISEALNDAPRGMTTGDRLVLIVIAEAANDTTRMAWESVATIARKTNLSKRSVYRILDKLEREGIILPVDAADTPPESLRYKSVVRRITPANTWPLIVTSEGEGDILSSSERLMSPVSPLTPTSPNPSTSTSRTTSCDSRNFVPRTPGPDPVGRAPRRKKQQVAVEVDPQTRIAQEMEEAEYAAGLKERIIEAADPEDIRRVEIKKGKAVNKDTAYGLAQHFREQVTNTGADWSSGLTHNAVGSLSKHFAQWQRDGKTADQIRAMVDVFVTEPAMRDVRVTPWKDFLAKRDRLYAAVQTREKNQAMETHRDDPNYWAN